MILPAIDFEAYWREFGSRVKAARVAAGMGRPGLAEQLGVSESTVWYLENGREPHGSTYVWLCAWMEHVNATTGTTSN